MFEKRNTDEFVILAITALTAVAIAPFAVLRFIQQDWLICILDWSLVVAMLFLFYHVYTSSQTALAKYVIATLFMFGMNMTVYLHGHDQLFWVYPATVSLYFFLPAKHAINFSIAGLVCLFPAMLTMLATTSLTAFAITLLTTNVFAMIFSIRQHNYQQRLLELSQKDPLTNAGNRRAMDEKLTEITYLNQRTRLSASLLMIDIDKFKDINDKLGHGVGDRVLKSLCSLIKYRIRFSDSLYRYGGEEFIIVAESTRLADAYQLAEQLRAVVADSRLIENHHVTLSIGVAEIIVGESAAQWLKRADNALYKAKNNGRNQVCISPNPTQPARPERTTADSEKPDIN